MEIIIGCLIMLIIAGIGISHSKSVQEAAADPDNTSVVMIKDLQELSKLPSDGKFMVTIYRQSGNLQQDEKVYTSSTSALRAVCSIFSRAKIDFVIIDTNDESELSFRRPWHSHRGKAEGKKVGSAVIRSVV